MRSSHQAVSVVDVLEQGHVIEDSIPVSDGSVTLDRTAAIRGRTTLTIPDMVPSAATSLLAPYGNELAVKRGIEFSGGRRELVQLGVFRIDRSDSDEPGRAVKISGQDRAASVADASLEAPYQQAAGVNYATAVQRFIASGMGAGNPTFLFDLAPTFEVTPLLVVQEQADRWATAQGWVASYGHEIHFNGDGVIVSASEPDPNTGSPVFDVDEGPDGILIDVGTSWDRTGMFNRVIAVGENPSNPGIYRGTATDVDPLSATYYYGKFGKAPRFFASPLISSHNQAVLTAQAILRRVLGLSQAVRFGSIVAPFLEPGDIINVRRTTLPINAAPHLIESLTIPLGAAGAMTGTTRTRRDA